MRMRLIIFLYDLFHLLSKTMDSNRNKMEKYAREINELLIQSYHVFVDYSFIYFSSLRCYLFAPQNTKYSKWMFHTKLKHYLQLEKFDRKAEESIFLLGLNISHY